MHMRRVYIKLRVRFDAEGNMTPVKIKWEDGRVFEVDKILDSRRAASDAGSMGIRYTVKILGHTRYLFFEDAYSDTGRPRWFVETRQGTGDRERGTGDREQGTGDRERGTKDV